MACNDGRPLRSCAMSELVPLVSPPKRVVRDHRDAELFLAEWMHWAGFKGALATQATSDGGLDIVSADTGAQVKYGARSVGRPSLQALYGAATPQGRRCLFFASGGFSRQAEQWADQVGMALFVFDADGNVRAHNQYAQRIARTARGLPPRRDPAPWLATIAIAVVIVFAIWGANLAGWFGLILGLLLGVCAVLFFGYLTLNTFAQVVAIRETLRRPPRNH